MSRSRPRCPAAGAPSPRPALLAVLLVALLATTLAPMATAARMPASGPVSRIAITGNAHTREEVVRRVLGVAEGDTLDADSLDAAWDRLEDCGWFRFVELDTERADDGSVVLTVAVEEDLSTYYGPLVRYSRRHKYLVGGWLEDRNLGGRGQTLRIEAAALHAQTAGVSWQVPWLAGVRGLTGTAALRGEQADFVFRPTRYRRGDAELGARWNFRGPAFVQTGGRFSAFRQRDDFRWATPARGADAPAGEALFAAGTSERWRLVAGIGLDTRDNPYYPLKGCSLLVEAARWTGDGSAGHGEYTGDARAFVPLPGGRHLLALRGWGRRVSGPATLDDALFLGGAETVRGAGFGSLEGEEGWLLTAEYRLPLLLVPIAPGGETVGFGLHAFTDGGQAWWDGARPGNPVFTWGAGAHVSLDTWQLRFEAARDEAHDWHFEFGDRFTF